MDCSHPRSLSSVFLQPAPEAVTASPKERARRHLQSKVYPCTNATSGRSCSAGSPLFFEAHALAMDEIPERAIADGNAAFGEFRHEPAHGHLGLGRDPLHEPAPFSNEIASPMATHLPTRGAARPAKPLRPTHDTRHAHREGRGNCSHAASSRD